MVCFDIFGYSNELVIFNDSNQIKVFLLHIKCSQLLVAFHKTCVTFMDIF